MGTGYTRQAAADIIPGAEITAGPLNAEFNQVRDAFDGSAGHAHDGSTGNGPKINLSTSATGFSIGIFAGDGTNLQFRTLTGTANEITITNGTGASGNPTVGLAATLALGGKAVTVQDNNFTVQNAADTTKKLMLSLTGITTGTTRTLTIPDVSDTIAVLAAAQSLTNKKLGSLTTNGFVKTSAGDGTLSVDTTSYQPLDSDLTAIAALSGTGIAVQTAVGTWANRQLTAPAAGITVTNPLGLAGNITLVLANDLAALEALAGTNNIYYRSGVDTWTAVTIGGNLTFSGGTLNAVSGTTGTVTNTGGSLTANSVVLGAGTNDSKVVAGIITDGASKLTLGVAGGAVGAVAFNNATSGSITLQPLTGALGSSVLSLPIATDTLIGKATTDTLTNKTFDTAGTGNVFKIAGTTVSSVTGTGAVNVMSAGPTLSGDVQITNASGNHVLGISTIAGNYSSIKLQSGGLTRWEINKNGDAEGGSNAGGNMEWNASDDAGAFNFNVMVVHRDTGTIDLGKGQLKFPASQNASSNANTLDDYEEGTFTPSFSSSGATFSYLQQTGTYVKVGQLIYVGFYLVLNGAGNTFTANQLNITGLPFTSAASGADHIIMPIKHASSTTAYVSLLGRMDQGASQMSVAGLTAAATSYTEFLNNNVALANNGAYRISGSYRASA